ncbi:hypothetical protein FRC11_009427 [Ceratobasidium sp. 423]|nr:hypothetical protein FRC11_009427 [Ceratobasidium sp. 423]
MTLPPMHAYNFEHSALRYAHGTRPANVFSAHSERQDPRPQRPTPDSVSPTQPKHTRRSSASEPLCTVAQNMCNMVCYLWFGRKGQRPSSPSTDAMQQFSPRPEFVSFIADLLATTQVSQSVITLALRYIYMLKQANPSIRGRRGSEYRLAVTALMLANKFLDDNTYTNKTWSDVSRISLVEINQMEKEFLNGLGHNLYVDLATYESWVLMLTGLIDAYHELQSPSIRERYPILPPIRAAQSACTSPKDYVYSSQYPHHPAPRHFPVPPPITPQQDVAMHVYTPPSLSPQTSAAIYTPPYPRQYTHTRHVHDIDMNDLSPRSESGNEVRRHSWYAPSPVIAPFANAGPPGVHWNQVPPPLRAPAPVYQQPTPTWSPIRGRRA